MKICPRCSIVYSEMWNACNICEIPLQNEDSAMPPLLEAPPLSSIEKVIENTNTLLFYLDKDLKPIMCNHAIESLTGYSRQEIFDGDWLQLFFSSYPSRKDIFKAVILSCLTSIKSRGYDVAITRKDGSECVLSWRNEAVVDTSGHISGIICTAQDITEKKHSEDNAATQYERLRNILASIKDYVLITTNLEGKITYYGTSAKDLFGWGKDMILGDISILFSEEEKDRLRSQISESIAKQGRFEEEVSLRRSENEQFPAILTATALFDTKNEKTGYIYIARDITERKKMEMEMIKTQKLAAIGRLASGVAHEINNPLVVIIGRIEMLLMEDGGGFGADVKRAIEIVKGQAERIRVIVDKLLSYARKKTPPMKTLDINEILKTIPQLLECHAEFKNVTWKQEIVGDLPKVKGNFNQLQEVFINIGLNACQAMPNGGVITVRSSYNKDGFVDVAVEDTGIGIKKEYLSELFNPFFTTKDLGTGLGLAICQTIISFHNGKIKVESEYGKGSIFRIKLPVKMGV